MKLGIVYHMPFWRGPDGTLYELEGSFARYVDSLAPYFDEIVLCVPFLQHAAGEGTPVRSANVTVAPLPPFDGPVAFYTRLWSMLPRLLQFVRGIDVLHCRVPTPAAVFAFAWARFMGRPTFVLVVGDLKALLPSMPYRGVKRLLWRGYTAFEECGIQWMVGGSIAFANGAALAAKHTRRGHAVIETRTTTIQSADIATRDDTCGGPTIRLLTVSRIDPRKGLRILPEALHMLVGRGIDATLDIVGPAVGAPGEAERRQIEADVLAQGVSGRLRFVGAKPLCRLLPLYRDYDMFVLPTLPGEGIPRVLLEAMTGGLPVVTTRVAGIPSLISDEVNGLLIDQPAASALADAVARIVSDAALRRRLIAKGYETARAHTLEAQAAGMMQALSARLGITLRRSAALPAVSA
jgi:glycosyltransferase involved in cell wall biosynthesis